MISAQFKKNADSAKALESFIKSCQKTYKKPAQASDGRILESCFSAPLHRGLVRNIRKMGACVGKLHNNTNPEHVANVLCAIIRDSERDADGKWRSRGEFSALVGDREFDQFVQVLKL